MTNPRAQMRSLTREGRELVRPKYRVSDETVNNMLMKSVNDSDWVVICDWLVLWWEDGRREKQQSKAVWTSLAFSLSLDVVYDIYSQSPAGKIAALKLVKNAYQFGWQGIQRHYSSFSSQENTVQTVFQL